MVFSLNGTSPYTQDVNLDEYSTVKQGRRLSRSYLPLHLQLPGGAGVF